MLIYYYNNVYILLCHLYAMENFDFEPIWHNYGLRSNLYFTEPLLIEQDHDTLVKLFVGREKEKEAISEIIKLGGGTRFLVIGEAGVGKTSLVNYMRSRTKEVSFFTPSAEIKFLSSWRVDDIIVTTISEMYQELKSYGGDIEDRNLKSQLENVFQLSELLVDVERTFNINTQKLASIFNQLVNEIIKSGFKCIILQYNNLDNIKDSDKLLSLLNDLREFLQNRNVIYAFLGDEKTRDLIELRPRFREIFVLEHVYVNNLSNKEIKEIINKRIDYLKIKEYNFVRPHTEECIDVLFDLYKGNLRSILNSLSYSLRGVKEPKTISKVELKERLLSSAERLFLNKLSPLERDILYRIISLDKVSNSDIAKEFKKKRQNVSAYFKKLEDIQAIELHSKEGTRIYYKPTIESQWLGLRISDTEIKREEKAKKEKQRETIEKLKDMNLFDFEGFETDASDN